MAKKEFKGIWLDAEILQTKGLTVVERILLSAIFSLDNGNGCFASNEYFARTLLLTKRTVSKAVNNLFTKGYIDHVLDTDSGNKRTLIPYRNKFHTLSNNIPYPIEESSKPSGNNFHHIEKNIENIIEDNIKKEYSYKDSSELSTTSDSSFSENVVPLDFKKWLTEQIQFAYPEIAKMEHQLNDWQIKKLESLGYERHHFEQALIDMNNKPELRSKTVYSILYAFAKQIHDNDPKIIHKAYLRKIHI